MPLVAFLTRDNTGEGICFSYVWAYPTVLVLECAALDMTIRWNWTDRT